MYTKNYSLKSKKIILFITTVIIATIFFTSASVFAQFKIILNFDDGYQGIYNNAFPLMKKYNLQGVIFMPTNFINQEGHLTLSQLKILKEAGWEIGSHTVHHPNLANLTTEGLKHEIIDSKIYLQKNGLIDSSYASFCSPMTVWNEEIATIVADNYQIARAKKLYIFLKNIQFPTMIKIIVKDTSSASIKSWVKEAYNLDQALILVFHEVAEGGNEYYYSSTSFKKAIDIIKEYKKDVITFYQLYKSINQKPPQ